MIERSLRNRIAHLSFPHQGRIRYAGRGGRRPRLAGPHRIVAAARAGKHVFCDKPPDNWRLSAVEAPGGPLTATGIPLVDMSVSVFRQPERVFASVRQLGSHLVNGDTLGAILATPFDGRFAVYGSAGWFEVRDKAHPERPEGWELTQCIRGARPQRREIPPASAVLANLESFADAALARSH
jgi:predicted dehydrogenase